MNEENKNARPQAAAPTEQELAQKRNAFLRYMTIIFAVAFVMVLISLVLQSHTAKTAMSDLKESNSSALTSAAANAELLQDENRRLQEELEDLKAELSAAQEKAGAAESLEKELSVLKETGDALAAENDELQKKADGAEAAYDALLTALRCTTHEGNVTFSKAMTTVEKNKEYLSDEALAVYEGLLGE